MGLLVPLYVAVLIGSGLGAWVAGRQAAAPAGRLPVAWMAVLALGGVALLVRVGPRSWARGVGGICVALSAGAGLRATRARARADLFRAHAPLPVDQAVARVRATGRPVLGVFTGQLDASETLVSPGGVACALYEAVVRKASDDGRPGPLISEEQGLPDALIVSGGREAVSAALAPGEWLAPVEVKRVRATGVARVSSPHVAEDAAHEQGLSFERVGRLGQRSWIAGELTAGPSPGTYRVRGAWAGKALLGVGVSPAEAGRGAARASWALFAVAGLLCCTAAILIGAF
jgi:hypothetical protein